jgi:hypothetical protein
VVYPCIHNTERDDVKENKQGYDPNSYSTSNFYLRSKDRQGHSHPVRVPDDLVAPLTEVVQDIRYPYRTWQDLVRDALVHRMHQLRHHEILSDGIVSPATEAALAEIKLEDQIAATQALRAKKELLIEAVREGVSIDKDDVLALSRGLTEKQQIDFAGWVKEQLIPLMDGKDIDG